MLSSNVSQGSAEEHKPDITDRHLLDDLGNFQKTSFASFLHYALELVDAVPTRDRPLSADDINQDLEMGLTSIVAAMEHKDNERLMRSIEEGLESYCQGDSKANHSHGLVKATNAALILLQPLSIGNSMPAANPSSDDFPVFMSHKRPAEEDERMPNIVCAARKHVLEAYREGNLDPQKLLELISLAKGDHVLDWKHHHTCWEYLRGAEPLGTTRPAYSEGYTIIPLKEYGHKYGDTGQVDAHPLNVKRCAEDATKVFYNTFGRAHIVNVAINDNQLRVWYFDRQSPIQTSAFNFVEDLPYFLLFLFALQRFTARHWGYIPELSPANTKVVEPINLSDSGDNATFQRLPTHAGYRHMALCGRATHVIFGRFTSLEKDTSAALKLSWRQKVRFPEGTFLREAISRLQKLEDSRDACDYLPTLLAERDFPEFSTEIIRKKLMIPVREEEIRLPYFIILPKYEPLIVRTTDWNAFFDDYLALIYCHFMLWTVGIEHGDISDNNLLWDPDTKKPKLCDFDLSHFSDKDSPPGFTNTGTYRFMAFDLLTIDAMEGEVKRLYRHDLESFIAVLIWVMFRYDNGKLKNDPNSPLAGWNSSSYWQCRMEREWTFKTQLQYDCPPSAGIPLSIWNAAHDCAAECMSITALNEHWVARPRTRRGGPLTPEEQKRLDHLNSTCAVTDFLDLLVSESTSSRFANGIAQKIKEHIRRQQ